VNGADPLFQMSYAQIIKICLGEVRPLKDVVPWRHIDISSLLL
jgi:hypothetical protein